MKACYYLVVTVAEFVMHVFGSEAFAKQTFSSQTGLDDVLML